MSLADGRPVRHDMLTGDRCAKVVRTQGEGWIEEKPCGAPLSKVVTRIPAVVTVIVCPACDVVTL